ncbi:glucose inhibited division A family protein [Mycobacterium kansasii 824]|nr:glucose inhibited division A family protein [Mycobacterium kansasii 824]
MTTAPAWRDAVDVVVVGTGVAGLAAALAAHRAGRSVVVLNKAAQLVGVTATHYAQGGIAVVLPNTDDSVEAHVADTLAAGPACVMPARCTRSSPMATARLPNSSATERDSTKLRLAVGRSRVKAGTRSDASCTPEAMPPAPRSSGRSTTRPGRWTSAAAMWSCGCFATTPR